MHVPGLSIQDFTLHAGVKRAKISTNFLQQDPRMGGSFPSDKTVHNFLWEE